MQQDGISVVIPAFNEEKFLPGTLTSVMEACRHFTLVTKLPAEAVVVNNASTDQTAAVARDHGANVLNHEIRNISSVRNAGIRAAKYSIIVTIDADCFLAPDSLAVIWEFMSDDRFIGASLGVKFISNKWVNKAVANVVQTAALLTSGIYGAMFCFRKDAALAIGGFREDRLIAEDSAFALAMQRYGKERGKKFGKLKSVQVGTLDRKDIGLAALPPLIVQIVKAFAGHKQTAEDLKFWYDPDR